MDVQTEGPTGPPPANVSMRARSLRRFGFRTKLSREVPMIRRWMVPTVFIGAGLLVVPAILAGRQQAGNPPGQPTNARVQIVNRGEAEAVPIVVQSGGEIQPVAV